MESSFKLTESKENTELGVLVEKIIDEFKKHEEEKKELSSTPKFQEILKIITEREVYDPNAPEARYYAKLSNEFAFNKSKGPITNTIDAAAARGQMNLNKFFAKLQKIQNLEHALIAAAYNGQLGVIKEAHMNIDEEFSTKMVMDAAAGSGYLNIVKWLHENRPNDGCTTNAIDHAAQNGHFRVVKWLNKHRNEGFTGEGLDTARKYGHKDIVDYLYNKPKKNKDLDYYISLYSR